MVDLASSAKDGPPKCPPDPKVLKPIRALRLESRRNAHSYPRRRRHPVKRLDGRAGLARHGRRLRRYMRGRHHEPCNDRVRCNRSRSHAAGRFRPERPAPSSLARQRDPGARPYRDSRGFSDHSASLPAAAKKVGAFLWQDAADGVSWTHRPFAPRPCKIANSCASRKPAVSPLTPRSWNRSQLIVLGGRITPDPAVSKILNHSAATARGNPLLKLASMFSRVLAFCHACLPPATKVRRGSK